MKKERTIFPNPNNDVLNFKGLKKIDYVEVIDNLGKTVMKIESPIENTINIKSLTQAFML
jgi:hypothetical protein